MLLARVMPETEVRTESVPEAALSETASEEESTMYKSLPAPPARESMPAPPSRVLSEAFPRRVLAEALPVPLATVPSRMSHSMPEPRV